MVKLENDPPVRSMKASFKDISRVFKATPLQQPVRPMSFILEDPSIHYTQNSNSPSQLSIFPSSSNVLGSYGFLGLESPSSIFPTPDHENSPHHQSDVNVSSPTFNIAKETSELLNFHIKYEYESPLQPPPEFTEIPEIPETYSEEPLSSFIDIPHLDEFDLGDFSVDFEVSESLNTTGSPSYHSALMQIPFRNQVSTQDSPHQSSLKDDEDYQDDEDDEFYYIPRSLELLPDMLREVPIYRDLFHHFVYVSADILVPAPLLYPQNPFKTLLPPIALGTPHLLALLLAFAATHRANYLRLPTPVDVISRLLSRVFQGLTTSLENEQEAISDATLTTAIMLTSYDILTDSVDASWKKHLHGARDIVVARGLAQPLLAPPEDNFSTPSSRSSSFSGPSSGKRPTIHDMISGIAPSARSVFEHDEENRIIGPKPLGLLRNDLAETDISYFLIRWFAYIDVIGALSSSHASAFLTTNENMAQLWAIHDWSIARVKERGIECIMSPKAPGSSPAARSHLDPSGSLDPYRNFPVKIDFLLGMDLDMLPVFSKVTYLVRQRQRWNHKRAKKEQQNLTVEQRASWQKAYAEFNQKLSSEAFEVCDLIISFCEAYELRRKQYVNNTLGQMLASKLRRDSSSSVSSEGSNSDLNKDLNNDLNKDLNDDLNSDWNSDIYGSQNSPRHQTEPMTMLPLRVQTYSHLCVMNTMFCYSAVIQLYRRVLELPSSSTLVQDLVAHITDLLDSNIPQGSPVESCMSFPIFTTACEVQDPSLREKYWQRMKGMERFGIGQVSKARNALELTWQKNIPWVDIMEENGWEFVLA